jgi:hypothetical protein
LYIQDGTIYDRNWRIKGHIEDRSVYDREDVRLA